MATKPQIRWFWTPRKAALCGRAPEQPREAPSPLPPLNPPLLEQNPWNLNGITIDSPSRSRLHPQSFPFPGVPKMAATLQLRRMLRDEAAPKPRFCFKMGLKTPISLTPLIKEINPFAEQIPSFGFLAQNKEFWGHFPPTSRLGKSPDAPCPCWGGARWANNGLV